MRGTWQTTSDGGSGVLVVAVIIAAAVLIGSGVVSAVAHALVVIAVVVGCTVVAAAALGIAWIVWQLRQDRQGQPIAARPVYQLPAEARPRLEASGRPGIGPGREVHLHLNVTPDQLAAIMRHHLEEDR